LFCGPSRAATLCESDVRKRDSGALGCFRVDERELGAQRFVVVERVSRFR
jgi:hypothetical protein